MAGSKPEIGAKIALDGAAEYRAALNEITASQRTLNKEMKLAESEFKKTGDAQKLYNEKVRLLNAQMDNQKKKLETAQKALKELSDKGVDKNSDLWRKWNEILLDSQTKMNNLQAELNSTTAAMKDTADATEQVTQATERATQETADYSETLKSIDKGVKFQNVLSGLKTVKDAVGGVISTAFRMGKALVMSQVSGGDWAREIMMGAAKAGVSVEEYQARLYAQAVGGINTDAITEGVKKTVENLATTDTELLKLYNDLGISTRDADGTVRDATNTFWDSVDALKAIEDQTTRSIYAQKLLGDQYLELRGLVDLGSEGYEKLIEEGKATATVTEESVKALADMDAAFERVSAAATKTGRNVQAELAPGFAEMADAISKILNDFDEFLQLEKGQELFRRWNEDLIGLADTIKNTDFSQAFQGLINTLQAITDSIEWITDNWAKVQQTYDLMRILVNPFGATKWFVNESVARGVESYSQSTGVIEPNISKKIPLTVEERNTYNALFDYLIAAREGYVEDNYEAIAKAFKDAISTSGSEDFINESTKRELQAVIDTINESGTVPYADFNTAAESLKQSLEDAMFATNQSARSGGGSAMTAFNAAIEKGTLATKDTLKSGVAAAFAGLDSVFASMGTAHGTAYANALSAQMSRINSMLSMPQSYAYGGTFGSAAQSPYASPTSGVLNASIYVGKQKFGQLTTPIVNAQMGAELQALR